MEANDSQPTRLILDSGFPLSISSHAVPDFLLRVRQEFDELPDPESLHALKLLTAQVIALEHHASSAAALADEEVQELAIRIGSPVARGHALLSWAITHPTPEHTDARIAAAREILRIAESVDDNDLQQAGLTVLLTGLLESGDIRSLDIQLLEETSRRGWKNPAVNPAQWFHCLRSILDGDAELAERQAHELVDAPLEDSPDNHHPMMTESLAVYFTQLGMIRWMQGLVDRVEEVFLRARRAYPEQLLWPTSLAWLWLLQGRGAGANSILRSLPEPESVPRDRYWLSTITVMAEISIIHGSRERAERLQRILLPFADRLVPIGAGIAFWGTTARTLGLLEERLGLLDLAEEHLRLAVQRSEKLGALPWLTEAQIELAKFSLRHDITDIPAYELLAEARRTSQARGFTALEQRSLALPRICVLGQFDVISLCGLRPDWTSRKARELLKMLIAAHGVPTSREVFMEVLWPGVSPAQLGNRFSVAINVIRRALDPDHLLPTQHFLVTEGNAVRLELKHLDIDVERFLILARRTDTASRHAAIRLYRGDAFTEEPYADWAVPTRDHAHRVWQELLDEEPSTV